FRKFARRHRLGVAASVAVVAAIVVGVVGATGGIIWALRERNTAPSNAARATTQAERSDQDAPFPQHKPQGVAPSVALGRDTTMLKEIVNRTAQRIDIDLKDQPEVQVDLNLTLGRVYFALQLYKEMQTNARHTLEIARATYGEESAATADV